MASGSGFDGDLRSEAFETPADTPEAFAAVIRAELAKWPVVVKEAGIRPE